MRWRGPSLIPRLVMFTGDLLAHSFPKTFKSITHDNDPEHYRAFVLKTFDFIALEFRKRFPDAKVLLTPGNNDEECGDYSIAENGVFLSDTADRAAALAREGDQFAKTWKSLGSFTIEHPTLHGVRIVSLNTIFWSNKYRASELRQGLRDGRLHGRKRAARMAGIAVGRSGARARESLAHVPHSSGYRRLGVDASQWRWKRNWWRSREIVR